MCPYHWHAVCVRNIAESFSFFLSLIEGLGYFDREHKVGCFSQWVQNTEERKKNLGGVFALSADDFEKEDKEAGLPALTSACRLNKPKNKQSGGLIRSI